jgi:hypothetical protein
MLTLLYHSTVSWSINWSKNFKMFILRTFWSRVDYRWSSIENYSPRQQCRSTLLSGQSTTMMIVFGGGACFSVSHCYSETLHWRQEERENTKGIRRTMEGRSERKKKERERLTDCCLRLICARAFLNVNPRARIFYSVCTHTHNNMATVVQPIRMQQTRLFVSYCVPIGQTASHVTQLVAISALFLVHQHQSLCEQQTVRGIFCDSVQTEKKTFCRCR